MSLKDSFHHAETSRKLYIDSHEEQHLDAAVTAYRLCQKAIRHLNLFSSNETLDDVASNELRYFLVDYHIATLIQQRVQIVDRLQALTEALNQHRKFLNLCDRYQACSTSDGPLVRDLLNSDNAKSLESPRLSAAERRQQKITQYKSTKALEHTLEVLSSTSDEDEDRVRSIGVLAIQLSVSKSIQDCIMIMTEKVLLESAASEVPDRRFVPEERISNGVETWRLDASESRVLNENGKVMKPFVLLSKRDTLRNSVRGADHSLPTMTIDEYLEQEKLRGGILAPQTKANESGPTDDADDNEVQEEIARKKAIDWDDFTEQNSKGAGNTMNRG